MIQDAIIYGAFGATVFFEVLAIYLPIFKHKFIIWLFFGPFYLIDTLAKTYLWMAGVLIYQDLFQTAFDTDAATFYLSDFNFKVIQIASYVLFVAPSNVAIMNYFGYI